MLATRKLARIQEPLNGIQFVISPETREELKPIVFFDAGKFTKEDNGFKIGFHPHSGIGIITYFHGTDLHHRDNENYDGIIHDGGAQWIRAGGGVWHEEAYRRKYDDATKGSWTGSIHQLWIQLPPEFEESEVEYANLSKQEIPHFENVKILAGEYKGVKGNMNIPVKMTYLDVHLMKGESWIFDAPKGQTTGFVFTRDGSIEIEGEVIPNSSMGILEHREGLIKVKALEDETNFILVIAEPSKFPALVNRGQIHTNKEAMQRSMERIKKIGNAID